MWPIFERLLHGSSPSVTPRVVDAQSPENSELLLDRARIAEDSTEWTYLQPDRGVRAQIDRFTALNVVLHYGEMDQADLVSDMRRGFMLGEFPRLTQVNQYLAAQTFDELAHQKDAALREKTFGVGQIEPLLLDRARDMRRFVQLLTLGYPQYLPLVAEFEAAISVDTESSNHLIDERAASVVSLPRHVTIGGEASGRSRIDLLLTVNATFRALGAPVSFNLLRCMNPYVAGIAACSEGRRSEIVHQILANQYPFNVANRDNWHSEIDSAV